MGIRTNYKSTLFASYVGYITQAVVNNFAPLLYVTFQKNYGITLKQLSFLAMFNFLVQLCVDYLSAKFVDKIGVRKCLAGSHFMAGAGLILLGILPDILPSAMLGITIAIVFYAVGGGLIEVLVSPVVEACPTKNKSAHMSILHSFYCWGQVLVILLSTIFFMTAGIANWKIMSAVWAIIPIANGILFIFVPLYDTVEQEESGDKLLHLMKSGIFRVLMVMMLCAGAAEIAVSQWASAFAEKGLGISKTAGDIAGPCLFALLMGIARVVYSKLSRKVDLAKYIMFSSALCLAGYIIVAFSPSAVLSLAGVGICGFAVGVMWPGTYSLATQKMPVCSTSVFAFLALAGDAGCSSGPYLVGMVSSAFGDDLKKGMLFAAVFPAVMIIAAVVLLRKTKNDGAHIDKKGQVY